uniref:Uncharacterized protein n=1 Tax=Prymnesium polylepis TaxID=72548 RepID=A0A7S4JU90_9EUKA|mmetsp:Transcript_6403/g.14896  ORF Transcript_6403/g.14896 Transcript_6403/m.14896 type:complete len:221 (+) Transcript_6403:40-702(+)
MLLRIPLLLLSSCEACMRSVHSAASVRCARGHVSMTAQAHVFVDAPTLPKPLLTHAASMDEAPKLSHSIAIALDEALDSAMLPAQTAAGLATILISDAEYMDACEACLQALGVPSTEWHSATLTPRDFDALRHLGFYSGGDKRNNDDTSIMLIDGSRVAGLKLPPGGQGMLDATAELADSLDDGFELCAFTGALPTSPDRLIVYGGRAPDGCIVGILAWL